MKEEKIICFHHADADGRMSAAIIKDKYPQTECVEINYGYDENKIEEDYILGKKYDMIYVVDFMMTHKHMTLLQTITDEFTWVDHHNGVKVKHPDLWNSTIKGIRRTDKAGCGLTWEYFYGNKEIHEALAYVQDYDLWKFKLEGTKNFGEFVRYFNVDDFVTLLNIPDMYLFVDTGKPLHAQVIKKVTRIVEKSKPIMFEGYNARIVACDEASLSGNMMCTTYEDCKIGINVSLKLNPKPFYVVNLRSFEGVDVSEIARKYGGNGHPAAAGFQLTLDEFKEMFGEE